MKEFETTHVKDVLICVSDRFRVCLAQKLRDPYLTEIRTKKLVDTFQLAGRAGIEPRSFRRNHTDKNRKGSQKKKIKNKKQKQETKRPSGSFPGWV